MIKTIEYKDREYPEFQASGFAARFAFPFAKEVCVGKGLDVGCSKREWCFPSALGIDLSFQNKWKAENLPKRSGLENYSNKDLPGLDWDYIFSSHCLEHLNGWVDILDHWYDNLRPGGVLFLYLPHPDQEYWLPWNNRKHVNILHPNDVLSYMHDKGYKNIFLSGKDLNSSYMIIGEK